MSHVKINVADWPTANKLSVRKPQGLYGEASDYISKLHRKQLIDRVLLVNGRIVWIGGKQYTGYPGQPAEEVNMEEERKFVKAWHEGAPF